MGSEMFIRDSLGILPSPQGGFAFPAATYFDGSHCDGSGCFVLGSCSQLCAQLDGVESCAGLGFDLARAHGSFEFEGGFSAIDHHCGSDPRGHDHVALGSLFDDDANLGHYGGLQALS